MSRHLTSHVSTKPGSVHRDPAPLHAAGHKERPDYYVAPTRDFTQYTKDYEEKYWSKETAFDWQQSVAGNLKAHVERLPAEEFFRVETLALPMVEAALGRHIGQILHGWLPLDDDALKAIGESIPCDRTTIEQALSIQAPLGRLQLPVAQLKDRLAILKREASELREQQRLGLFKQGTILRRLETEAERREQATQLSRLVDQIDDGQRALKQATAQCKTDREELQAKIREQLDAIEPRVLAELEATRELVSGNHTVQHDSQGSGDRGAVAGSGMEAPAACAQGHRQPRPGGGAERHRPVVDGRHPLQAASRDPGGDDDVRER